MKDKKFRENTILIATLFFAVAIFGFVAAFTDPLVWGSYSISFAKLWLYTSLAYCIFAYRWWKTSEQLNGELVERTGFIKADEYAVISVFEDPKYVRGSGLPFVPLGVCQIQYLPAQTQQKELPGEPRDIYQGEMKDLAELPKGKVPPNRVTFRNSVDRTTAMALLGDEYSVKDDDGNTLIFQSEAPNDGLANRVTADVVLIVRWKIKKGEAINFIRNIVSVDNANKQLEDELFGVVNRLLPLMSVAQAVQNFRWISAILKKAAIKRTGNEGKEGDWGVQIEGAFIKAISLHHGLNKAIAQASEVEFIGRSERELLEQTGAGKARASGDYERETLVGRAAGLRQLAEQLGIKGEEAIAQFVAGELAKGEGTIVFGASGLGEMAVTAASLFKKGAKQND